MFAFILDTLKEQGRSILAYEAVAKKSFTKAVAEPQHAAAFYLIATSAESFAELHERMPMSKQDLEQSFEAFQKDIETLQAAYEAGEPETILAALNRVAAARASTRA
ncbi:hypothetical protein [Pseudooceanicola nanhaiensis]|uniref:hypothetical protein n=1 Tax=Pseudooceanicola nanhaiensis TaxID=375761 RepID=UPI001CD3E2F2|nr:hypothetical protein [Pseudooceanicola nanhaiensis]MCA0918818.1 hypothetical protein [Pseudooceanicola nanhaiensis]